jgi:hypothetical protein
MYASVLLIGVTLSFGSVVAVAALNQFGQATNSDSLGSSLESAGAGRQLSLVYGTVPNPGSGGCTAISGGVEEGTGFSLALYNYGSASFFPAQVFDNGTQLNGPFSPIPPGSITSLSLTLPCSHPSGQVFLLVSGDGDEVQVGT